MISLKKELAVVLVEPEYEENIGYAARAMANFSLEKLILVNPKALHYSGLARSRAMHGRHILKNAKKCSSLEEALKGYSFSIATTAKLSKYDKAKRSALSLEEAAKRFSGKTKIALVFGSEKNGLTNEQLAAGDSLMHIPASKEYSTFNLSHAVTIFLYEFSKNRKKLSSKVVKKQTKDLLLNHFKNLIYEGEKIRNKEETFKSFRAMVARSLITEKETKSIIAVFAGVLKGLKRK